MERYRAAYTSRSDDRRWARPDSALAGWQTTCAAFVDADFVEPEPALEHEPERVLEPEPGPVHERPELAPELELAPVRERELELGHVLGRPAYMLRERLAEVPNSFQERFEYLLAGFVAAAAVVAAEPSVDAPQLCQSFAGQHHSLVQPVDLHVV